MLQTNFSSLGELRGYLSSRGCDLCSLGFQPGLNGCCLARGNPASRRILLGEAPGETEDAESLPFMGPAGRLLDRVLASIDMDTNQDFYLTNVVLCRPISKFKWQRNFTPLATQQKTCRSFLDTQIRLVKPKLIVTLGNVATKAVLGQDTPGITISHGTINTKELDGQLVTVYPLLHPAALLHAKRDPLQERQYKEIMWRDVCNLKNLIIERKL